MSDLLPLVLVPAALWLTLTDRLRGVIAGALFMLGIGIALQVRAVLWNYLFVASCLALSLLWLIRSYGAFVGRVSERCTEAELNNGSRMKAREISPGLCGRGPNLAGGNIKTTLSP